VGQPGMTGRRDGRVFHFSGSATTFTFDGIWSRLVRFSIW
jgi:hypothetical protein